MGQQGLPGTAAETALPPAHHRRGETTGTTSHLSVAMVAKIATVAEEGIRPRHHRYPHEKMTTRGIRTGRQATVLGRRTIQARRRVLTIRNVVVRVNKTPTTAGSTQFQQWQRIPPLRDLAGAEPGIRLGCLLHRRHRDQTAGWVPRRSTDHPLPIARLQQDRRRQGAGDHRLVNSIRAVLEIHPHPRPVAAAAVACTPIA